MLKTESADLCITKTHRYWLLVLAVLLCAQNCLNDHRNCHDDLTYSNHQINFVDVSGLTGISPNPDEHVSQEPYGIVNGDFNCDGWIDLIFLNHGPETSVFCNLKGVRFERLEHNGKIFELPKADYPERGDRHGAGCGDFNNDGWPDLLITSGAAHGAALGAKEDELHVNLGNFRFKNVTKESGAANAYGRARRPCWADFDRDGNLDVFINNFDSPSVLYHSTGNGTFADKSNLLPSNNGYLWAIWIDFNSDGWPDLFSPQRPRQLLRNQGNGTFSDVTAASGLNRLEDWFVSQAWADMDNDGDMDIFLGGHLPVKSKIVYLQNERIQKISQLPGEFRQDETLTAAEFGDLDNDGYQDLVVLTTIGIYIYRNRDGNHLDPAVNSLLDIKPGINSDLRLIDYDRDGGLDIAVFGSTGRYLLRNTSTRCNWLELSFHGDKSNAMGIGALIEAESDNGTSITRQNYGSLSNGRSTGCGPVHLGLGNSSSVNLNILWPSGKHSAIKIKTNQSIRIDEE
jgi:hypothetical protein